MTDLTPNDALCPQGEHAPGAEPLRPAAQAIVAAFNDRPLKGNWEETCLTAALRARADHIRADIISIATELERTND